MLGARDIALRVLLRVLRDGAFASASLDAELARHPQLSERDHALATELVYGSIRNYGFIVSLLAERASRKLKRRDVELVAPMVLGVYQLLFLDRVPAHAAVDAAVRQVRAARGSRVSGFANALLRKVAGQSIDRRAAGYDSVPAWLRERFEAELGEAAARGLVGEPSHPLCIRWRRGAELAPPLRDAEPGQLCAEAYWVRGQGDIRRLEAYRRGDFVIQEEGAQFVAHALGARPGQRVWDACAGRGQKSALLRELIGPEGELWASDFYPAKLEALRQEFSRLGLDEADTLAVDLTRGVSSIPEGFDRVLVDAPCSGTGTLRRRPEILLRLEPSDVQTLARTSEQILRNALGRVRPGGRLVYAVCSVLAEEGAHVGQRVSDVAEPIAFDAPLVREHFGDATAVMLLPHEHGTDGFFLASLTPKQ